MYNAELKERYIETKEKEVVLPYNFLKKQFENISETEEELGKDVYDFSVRDIIAYYKELDLVSLESLSFINSAFSMYVQWCLEQNLVKDNQNHFSEITKKLLQQECVNKAVLKISIITQEELYKILNRLPNPRDQFVLACLFEGIKGREYCEIAKMKKSDIDENGVVTLCTGRKMQLSDKLLNIIEDSVAEHTYYSMTRGAIQQMNLLDKGYIFKDYPNATRDDISAFQIGRKIYNSITRSLNYVDVGDYMTGQTIFNSGKIHEIKKRAKELNISVMDYISSDKVKEIEEKYDFNLVKSVFTLKYEEQLRDE